MIKNRNNILIKTIRKNRFFQNRQGGTAVEFALVASLFLALLFGILDFGRLFFDWNKAAKATELGVRMAIVSDMVAVGLQDYDGLIVAGGNGLPVPVSAINGGQPVICKSGGNCNGYGFDQAGFDKILTRMQGVYPQIQAENLVVEYHHIGFGFSGNPYGSDISPNVTVRLENMQFNFLFPGLQTLATLTMPELKATLTGEDFRN
ncbi:MAG: pilus assembly protein [Emcibacter sp.]|nr:pilus assembly protein [Emcibacter sp.]